MLLLEVKKFIRLFKIMCGGKALISTISKLNGLTSSCAKEVNISVSSNGAVIRDETRHLQKKCVSLEHVYTSFCFLSDPH